MQPDNLVANKTRDGLLGQLRFEFKIQLFGIDICDFDGSGGTRYVSRKCEDKKRMNSMLLTSLNDEAFALPFSERLDCVSARTEETPVFTSFCKKKRANMKV